jgi:hypothetical protein
VALRSDDLAASVSFTICPRINERNVVRIIGRQVNNIFESVSGDGGTSKMNPGFGFGQLVTGSPETTIRLKCQCQLRIKRHRVGNKLSNLEAKAVAVTNDRIHQFPLWHGKSRLFFGNVLPCCPCLLVVERPNYE